ncbi:MAG: DUF2760 domain-containing protein [Kofleriaceae bacterium]|nr:DUF2760 domain-containing protein [Kofleriaceae bacterium]
MSRIGLAFSCFFRVLFKGQLPDAARPLLPAGDGRAAPGLPAAGASAAASAPAAPSAPAERDGKANRHRDQAAQRDGALALLALLQREGRLVDFARESLDGHSDADIGAAARDVHRGCRKVLEQVVTLEPMLPGAEDAAVTVPLGFDPAEIRLIGETRGEPPFAGTLRHHGWRATELRLPALAEGVDRAVVAPAEVEVGARS